MSIKLYLASALLLGAAAHCETFRSSAIKIVAPIDYGETTTPFHYTGKPEFVGFNFNARPGDHIEVTVKSKDGRFKSYLTNEQYESLAGGSDHFSAVIPTNSRPATYFILVAGESGLPGTFTVDLERPTHAASEPPAVSAEVYLGCTQDSDCIAVDREGCCHNGYKDAVNAEHVAAYRAANACKNRRVMCPQFIIQDDRVAVCNTERRQCQMLKAESIPCGGNLRGGHECPAGYACRISGIPDAGGHCVQQ